MRAGSTPAVRAVSLFANFFLIIFAYYMVKPASRSIYLEHFRADQLPYAWIASALLLAVLMPLYGSLTDQRDRRQVVVVTCLVFCLLLVAFGLLLGSGATAAANAFAFYIFVDIMSVVLVEQFWSLTNSAYATHTGSRWYGVVGSGGLVGGIVGGLTAGWLVRQTPLDTFDMLYVCALLLLLLAGYATWLVRLGIFAEQNIEVRPPGLHDTLTFTSLFTNRYILLITATILLAQLVEPIVEYQFMSFVEQAYADRELRTAYLSVFLSVLGMAALLINLLVTPLILRYLGAIAGMLMQPVILFLSSAYFNANPGLNTGAVMKISDRGLSYSINRASKEMLYVPVEPRLIYRAKAWIDMVGYRMFKILGAVLVLALTQWFGIAWSAETFSYIVMPVCVVWLLAVTGLKGDYDSLCRRERPAQSPAPA